MKNIKALRDDQVSRMNPGQHIGTMLLDASNSPEYLVSQLSGYLEAAKADLKEQKEMMATMMAAMNRH